MTEENVFWKIVATASVLIIASMGGCVITVNAKDDDAISEMVAKGADPLAAKCAIRPNDAAACVITAARVGGK